MEKDQEKLVIEMTIREISTQCKFAQVAYSNISQKNNDIIFSSIHSFLSHCGVVSKLLWSTKLTKNQTIAQTLQIPKTFKIKKRLFRGTLEHYDEHLKGWIRKRGVGVNIFDYNIGPRKAIKIDKGANVIFVRHYDPVTFIFTLIDKDLNLKDLYHEILDIKSRADKWIEENTVFRNK